MVYLYFHRQDTSLANALSDDWHTVLSLRLSFQPQIEDWERLGRLGKFSIFCRLKKWFACSSTGNKPGKSGYAKIHCKLGFDGQKNTIKIHTSSKSLGHHYTIVFQSLLICHILC